jgi:hypothetical protein
MPRGQVINLETGENELSASVLLQCFPALMDTSEGGSPISLEAAARQSEGTEAGADADERIVAQLAESLRDVPPVELAREVVNLHERRVSAHKAYEAAFKHLLNSPGGGAEAVARMYPFVVGCVTARFIAISRAIRAVASVLEAVAKLPPAVTSPSIAESAKEAAGLMRKLQKLEQERLEVVGASHLERSRLWVLERRKDVDAESQVLVMSRRTFTELQKRIGDTAVGIEETVSELRYCVADLQGDD